MDKMSMTVRINTVFGEKTFDMPADQALKLIFFAEELSTLSEHDVDEPSDGNDAVIDGNGLGDNVRPIVLPIPKSVPKSRNETLFGDRSTWNVPHDAGETQNDSRVEQESEEASADTDERYTGLLLVECEHCGELQGYFTKYRLRYHQCKCGHRTALHDLVQAHAHCKCGSNKTYLTNVTANEITYNCHKCGAPIDMALNYNATAYVTVGR